MRNPTIGLAACLLTLACGGGGGGSSPSEPAPQLVFQIVGQTTSVGCDCLAELELLLDGRSLGRRVDTSGTGQVTWATSGPTGGPAATRGQHRLIVRITQLRTSSADLVASAGGAVLDITNQAQMPLPPFSVQQRRMRAGDEFVWDFRY